MTAFLFSFDCLCGQDVWCRLGCVSNLVLRLSLSYILWYGSGVGGAISSFFIFSIREISVFVIVQMYLLSPLNHIHIWYLIDVFENSKHWENNWGIWLYNHQPRFELKSLWSSDAILWWCGQWVNIGSGNGLLPDGTKPMPEPMLLSHWWDPVAFSLEHFHTECRSYYSV